MKRVAFCAMVVSVGVLLSAACGGGAGAPAASPTSGAPGGKPGEVALSARFAAFEPAAITVARGQAISVKLTSADSGHTFTIDELGINIVIGAGQSVVQEIKVDQAGTYTFYCSVLGHRATGMQGTLKVE